MKWNDIVPLAPKPHNLLHPEDERELRDFIRRHEGMPTFDYETKMAQLRLMKHVLEKLKAEIVRRESSFIYLDDLEEVAKDFAYGIYCVEQFGDVDLYPPEPTNAELREDGLTDADLEERHRWDHVGGTFATSGRALCEVLGDHDIVDCSDAGPDSGNMDHRCRRCGQYWSVPLY